MTERKAPQAPIYTNLRGAVKTIAKREKFRGASIMGHKIAPLTLPTAEEMGSMPYDYAVLYSAMARSSTDGLYVVFSYRTPIAWYDSAEGWIVPDVRYSATTSRHLTAVRMGIRLAGQRYRARLEG